MTDAATRTEIVSLFLSACKLERDVSKPAQGKFSSGGLYDRLYLCLYHSISHLLKIQQAVQNSNFIHIRGELFLQLEETFTQ